MSFILLFCYLFVQNNVFCESDKPISNTEIETEPEVIESIEGILKNLVTVCKIQERASDEDVENILRNVIPNTKVEKCFVACWMERFQIIKEEKFCPERYVVVSSYDTPDDETIINNLKEIMTECKYIDIGKPERCDLAYLIIQCIHDAALRRGLDPKIY